jgi:hypothetical protein
VIQYVEHCLSYFDFVLVADFLASVDLQFPKQKQHSLNEEVIPPSLETYVVITDLPVQQID